MPVEIADGIRAVGNAHTNADAAGINLFHNPFRVKMSCVDGTDLGAGRMIALHTGHGNEAHLHTRVSSLGFMDEIHPEFPPPELCPFFSYGRVVVFLPAGHHTSLAARAFIQIDHHSPAVHHSPRVRDRVSRPGKKFWRYFTPNFNQALYTFTLVEK
jgi:hypothetical protein